MFDSGAKRLFMIVLVLNGLAGLALIVIYSSSQKPPQVVVQQAPAPAPELAMGKVVVAKAKLNFGNELTPDNLKVVAWPADALPEGSFSSVPDLFEGASRRVALRTIEPNEPVTKPKVSGFGGKASLSHVITPGMRAVPVRVNEATGVAGFVLPGDRVDIMVTRDDPNGRGPLTSLLLSDVQVLAVDQAIEGQAEKPRVVNTVTVEVTLEQTQELILAQRVGMITLTLRNATPTADENLQPRTKTLEDLTPPWERFERKPRVAPQVAAEEPVEEESPKVTVFRGMSESREEVVKETPVASTPSWAGDALSPAGRRTAPSIGGLKPPATAAGDPAPAETGEPVRLVPPNFNQNYNQKKTEETKEE